MEQGKETVKIKPDKRKKIIALINRGDTNGKIAIHIQGVSTSQIEHIRKSVNPATPETKRKLKRDPLITLHKNGKLDIHDLDAADYIRAAYILITSGIAARCSNYGDFIDNKTIAKQLNETSFQIMVQIQYKKWRELCLIKKILSDPIVDLLTEPVSLADVDKLYKKRKGTASILLCDGLKLYSRTFHPGKSY